jgi:ABC-2 type transport system permease protein
VAVYERTYRPYDGPLTPRRSRFAVLPRYALRETFRSRAFVAFYVVCFLWPVILMVLTYFSHNLRFLEWLGLSGGDFTPGTLFRYDGSFFVTWLMKPQFWMSLFLTFLVAPALVAPDLSNNGLALYLSRPFGKTDYIAGKASVLVFLLSTITWLPGLLLFLLKGYLSGEGWITGNLRLAAAIFAGSWIVIALLTLIGLSLSAYVRGRPLAGLAVFGLFLLGLGLANVVNAVLGTRWGSIVNLYELVVVTWSGLFGVESAFDLPVAGAWAGLAAVVAFFVWLLYRKVEAYEVVK